MAAATSVVVVHSANVQEDREALMAIFPDKFQVEKHSSVASESLQWEESMTLVLMSCTYAKGTYSSLVMDDDDIRQAVERANLFGVKAYQQAVSGLVIAKLSLPGGASLLLSAPEGWKSSDSRNAIVTRLLAPADGPMSPRGKRRTLGTQHSSMTDMASVDGSTTINRLFPTLRVQTLGRDNKFEPYSLNAEEGIPIETDLFVGKLLLVIRPANPEEDPYWNDKIFSKKKRRAIMQLQGKLKYVPEGELFAGMEISDPMRLGLLASGLCNLLLKMSRQFNGEMHYSFGDDKERPHICFPASTFFEEFVVTQEGELAPELGTVFQEDPAAARERKAYKRKISWNTTDTYSMGFHSMYLDFPSWSIVHLPIGRDITLQTFWGNSSTSVVLYEVDTSSKKHLTSAIKYLAAVEFRYLGKDAELGLNESLRQDEDSDGASEDQFVEVDIDNGSISTNGDGSLLPPMNDDSDQDEGDQEFFDTLQSQSLLPASLDKGLTDISAASSHAAVMHLIDKCCPCVIDMPDKKGKYAHVFAFYNREFDKGPLFRTMDLSQELLGDRYLSEIDDAIFTHRLSGIEKNRRKIGLRYAEALMGKASKSKMNHFQRLRSHYDKSFLNREKMPRNDPAIVSAIVARAVSDRHWIEEWACVTKKDVLFYRLDKNKPYFRIGLGSIVKCEPLPQKNWPLLSGYQFLSIESFGRTTCIMLNSEKVMDVWIKAVLEHRPNRELLAESTNSFSNHLIEVDEPSSEFLRRSSMWDCSKRKLLNGRQFSFRTPAQTDPESTLLLAEVALRKATALQIKGPNDADLIDFLDSASALKEADAHSLNGDERTAFFLNVYHVIIMHAFIVLGPPDSSLKWPAYFNTISYQCADEVFSLSELEHNIIRAEMSFPSQFLSRFVLPKSHYQFALSKKDIRLNFALNCGSLSVPTSAVPVYSPDKLQAQLDKTTCDFLEGAASIKPKGSRDASIVLPRVCQWFADDFGDGSGSDILKAINPFLSSDKRSYLQRLWNDKKQAYDLGLFNLKYAAYSFECRLLTLEDSEKDDDLHLEQS